MAGQLLAPRPPAHRRGHVAHQGRRQRLPGGDGDPDPAGQLDPWGAQIGFADWAEEWKATIVDLRPSTKARDLGYLQRYVLPRFESLELGEIDHMMVRSWVAELSASGLDPSTTTKAAQLLSKIMRSAVQAGYLPKSPCDGVRLPRIERVEMRFLDPAEVMALADAMDPRYRATVLLAAYGGL
jgi:integrase